MYKIETHLHTRFGSKCGRLSDEEIISAYQKAGYHAIAVTDHFSRKWIAHAAIDLETETNPAERFLEGCRRLREAAQKAGIAVYDGAEIRFDENKNDYLLYGFPPSLLDDPEEILSGGLAAFYPKCRAAGALVVQAHPFRNRCYPADPACLDGAEVVNHSPWHENKNALAQLFADENQLIPLSGSDCHRPEDAARGGILCEVLPKDTFELAEILRRGEYRLIK